MKTQQDRIRSYNGWYVFNHLPNDVIKWLTENGFFTAPASTKYHGNYEGGLFDHSYEVMLTLLRFTEMNKLTWENPRSPYVVGMFHDLCKIDQYVLKKPGLDLEYETPLYEYNKDTLLKGHGDKSVMLLSQLMQLTGEEIMCIRYHMGAFTDKEEWPDYTRAVREYPNVLWTHTADMMASHVIGV
jgi:hypothetical protein